MRNAGLAAILLSLPGALASQATHKPAPRLWTHPETAAAKPEPVFSFMGDDTEQLTSRTQIGTNRCDRDGAILKCAEYLDASLAGKKLDYLVLRYNAGKLYSVIGAFKDNAYLDLRAAFTAKYGNPSKEATVKWQSKGGAVFDNLVSYWKFKGGMFELDSMGGDTSTGSFSFVSETNAPPADKPKVDF